MSTIAVSRLKKLKRNGYAVAGFAYDGVAILKFPRGSSRLTDKQIDAAVASVRSTVVAGTSRHGSDRPTRSK